MWDTKVVATGGGWTPDHARIAGMASGWNRPHHGLVATKIEIVRHFLLNTLRREAAYFHRHLDRGEPLWDGVSDRVWAEETVTGIG